MLRYLFIVLIAISAFVSCKQKTGDTLEEYVSEKPEVELKLNNGEKWKANEETTRGIKNMIAITEDFNGTDTAAFHYLGLVLLDEYKSIFENCTMMGEAHEQLHAYLFPLYYHLANIESCTDSCSIYIAQLTPYLNSYTDFFE